MPEEELAAWLEDLADLIGIYKGDDYTLAIFNHELYEVIGEH